MAATALHEFDRTRERTGHSMRGIPWLEPQFEWHWCHSCLRHVSWGHRGLQRDHFSFVPRTIWPFAARRRNFAHRELAGEHESTNRIRRLVFQGRAGNGSMLFGPASFLLCKTRLRWWPASPRLITGGEPTAV